MANTIDTDLLLDTLSLEAINYLGNVLAPLSAYARKFTSNALPQTKAVQVPVVTGGSATLKNPSNFENGDADTSNIPVTVDHYSQPFHLTSAQQNQRLEIVTLAQSKLNTLATTIAGVVTQHFTTANFTATPVTVAQSSFAAANAKALLGQLGKNPRKNLILDSVAFAQFAPENKNAFQLGESGAYGFNGVFQQTTWAGATTNVYGVACGTDAICVAAGIPEMHPSGREAMYEQRTITIPGIELPVQINMWWSSATRTIWCSYDIMFGAAPGLSDRAILIKSA